METKFDVQFEGTLDEFNAWAAGVFKTPGSLHVKVHVVRTQPEPDKVRSEAISIAKAVTKAFGPEITVMDAEDICFLVADGSRIKAIKKLRTVTGCTLADAKDFIDGHFRR